MTSSRTLTMIIPPKLEKGDTIGLIAPSSPLREGRLELGLRFLQAKGFAVKIGSHLHESNRFLAGSDVNRAQDIMQFFRDPSVKAIMATCGGYGSQRLLPLLDFDYIRQHPKLLTGFSDTTALQLAVGKKSSLVTASGFVFRDLDEPSLNPLIEKSLMTCLAGESFDIQEGETAFPGKAEGPLIGGTLSLITALLGTPYEPNFENAVLLIEEVFAEPFQVDCMLSQLELAGIFKRISGIIFGQFVFCEPRENPERDGSIKEVVNEWARRIQLPCIAEFPYGHGPRRAVLPLGRKVIIDADATLMKIV